jgi:hypothetical protein
VRRDSGGFRMPSELPSCIIPRSMEGLANNLGRWGCFFSLVLTLPILGFLVGGLVGAGAGFVIGLLLWSGWFSRRS